MLMYAKNICMSCMSCKICFERIYIMLKWFVWLVIYDIVEGLRQNEMLACQKNSRLFCRKQFHVEAFTDHVIIWLDGMKKK